VVNGRGIGVRYDVAAGGWDVVVQSKERVGTLPQTLPSIAAEESFPRDSIRISITEVLRNLPRIVNGGQALVRAQAPHGNTVHLNIGE
jgi:hypothetical protein